ncbi:MAG TPA: type II secretion system F family protein [Alphaproteobacteria bacterium]
MPDYAYRAMDGRGRVVRGTMSAANALDLESRLGGLSLDLLSERPLRAGRLGALLGRRVRITDMMQLCIHMGQLLRAGVPVLDCLSGIRDVTGSPELRDVLSAAHNDVRDGQMLSGAFARHPRAFSGEFVGLVRAGEETGNLADSFADLARHLRWLAELRQRIRRALRYPLVIGLLLAAVFALMLGYVVPSVVGYLREVGVGLPFLTVALLAVSEFFIAAWPALVAVPVALWAAAALARRASPAAAVAIDAAKLRLPLLGPVLRRLALSRFSHYFAVLLRGGVPLLASLETARGVVGNLRIAAAVAAATERVASGHSLARALESTGEFPSLVVRMVGVGEEAGALLEALDNVTYFYDREVDDAVSALIAALEPAVTAVLGALLAWVAVAVLGPIYNSFGALG